MRNLVFQTYSNNEIRIGWNDLPSRPKGGGDSQEQRRAESAAHIHDKQHDDWLRDNKIMELRDKDGTLYRGNSRDGFERVEADSHKLDIICKFQEEGRRPSPSASRDYSSPPRPTTFTRNARHRIIEAGELFNSVYSSTHKGYFATFTLPGSTEKAYDALSRWSGFVANRVLQTLRDSTTETLWFYVWELQKRGALHLHLFFSLPNETAYLPIAKRLRDSWYRALQSITDSDGTDMFLHQDGVHYTSEAHWQFDCQLVEKSPAQYVSKYVSKQANAPVSQSELAEGGCRYFPKRWWGMCREFTRLINENRFEVCMDAIEKDVCNQVVDCMDAELSQYEPVQTYEYETEVGGERNEGKPIGRVFRKIFYFPPEIFHIVDFLFRKSVVKLLQTFPKHLRRWKYDSLNYKGVDLLYA